jgi:MerR family redox-sensitive transcriptional activator SoxR
MSQEWQGQLDQQIMMLLQLGQQLDQCIGCGCLSLEQYLLRNPEDCLGEGPIGAHFQEILFLMNQKNESEF